MTNFPWPMDKPIDEIEEILDFNDEHRVKHHNEWPRYLIARLKKSESERDGLVEVINDNSRSGAGKYQRVVMEARLYIHNGFKKVPSAFD